MIQFDLMNRTVKIRDSEKTLRLLFMGDFCPIGNVEDLVRDGDIEQIYASHKTELKDKDLSIANLESPLTSAEPGIIKDGPNIKANPIAVELAAEMDIDVLGLGNNHIMDYGNEGLFETIKVLDKRGISHLGAGSNVDEAKKPLIVEKNDVRISFLSFCETEFNLGSEDEAGCAPIELDSVCEAIQRAKKETDLVIPLLHCGSEHYPLPSPRIKKLCRRIAECGASAVICHHTHTAEGYEIYKNIPILYGLGNFIFGYWLKRRRSQPDWNKGLMVGIDFHKTGAVKFDVIPYFYDADGIRLVRLEGKEAESFFDRLDKLNKIIEDDDKLERIWRQYSLRRYKSWYSPTLKKARLYFWRNKARRNMILWHNRTNESHNDVITTAVDALRRGKIEQDREIKDLLDKLIGRQTIIMKIKRLIRAWI